MDLDWRDCMVDITKMHPMAKIYLDGFRAMSLFEARDLVDGEDLKLIVTSRMVEDGGEQLPYACLVTPDEHREALLRWGRQ
jgi:hypothetical protein